MTGTREDTVAYNYFGNFSRYVGESMGIVGRRVRYMECVYNRMVRRRVYERFVRVWMSPCIKRANTSVRCHHYQVNPREKELRVGVFRM